MLRGNYGGPFVYLNEGIVPEAEATISVYDHGFLYGAGVFETMRSYQGQVFLLKEHLERLRQSAAIFAINISWNDEELTTAIKETIAANNLEKANAYLRLSVSRGEGPIGLDPSLCKKPTLVIMGKELPPYNEVVYREGIEAIICQTRRNSIESTNPQAKSFNFLNNIAAKLEVTKAGAAEGIMLNQRGEVAEGTVSNLFFVKNEKIYTPEIASGILVGITRNYVTHLAESLGYDVIESTISIEDINHCDEVFLTNSTQEIVPIVKVDKRKIGTGVPGPISRELLGQYRQNIANTLT